MSQIGNKLLAGFFATPISQGEHLKKLIEFTGDCSILDPTCGRGEILYQLAAEQNDRSIATYGVELDKSRATAAKELLTNCIHAPIESMVIQNDFFSMLFLNPPYDHTMKSLDDDTSERKEWTELQRNLRYLKEDGLLIYIIPSYRFADKKIARYLSTHFKDIGVLRFTDEDYADFKQCVFIGKKSGDKHKEIHQELYSFLIQMGDEDFVSKKVAPLNAVVGRKTWTVPGGLTEIKTFFSKLEKKEDFYEGINTSKGFKALKERSKPKKLEIGGNPMLPINSGQMALLLASGAINGMIGEGEHLHLVQGVELVSKLSEEEIQNPDNGTKTIVTKSRTSRQVSVKILTPSGLIKKLV